MPDPTTRELLDAMLDFREAVERRFDGVEARLDAHDRRFDGVDARLDAHDRRFENIERRLTSLEMKVDAGFEGVNHRLEKLEASCR